MTPADHAELRILAHALMRRRTRAISECIGKQSFDNRVDAARAIRPRVKGMVEVYRCGSCGSLHVGSREEDRKVKRAKRRIYAERRV